MGRCERLQRGEACEWERTVAGRPALVISGSWSKFQIKNRPHGTVGGKLLTIARAGERRAGKEGEFRGGYGGVGHHVVPIPSMRLDHGISK